MGEFGGTDSAGIGRHIGCFLLQGTQTESVLLIYFLLGVSLLLIFHSLLFSWLQKDNSFSCTYVRSRMQGRQRQRKKGRVHKTVKIVSLRGDRSYSSSVRTEVLINCDQVRKCFDSFYTFTSHFCILIVFLLIFICSAGINGTRQCIRALVYSGICTPQ